VATYAIAFLPRAEKELDDLPAEVKARVLKALGRIAGEPRRSPNVGRFKGLKDGYRVRVGDYRVIYTIEDKQRFVLVLEIGHRREIYQRRRRRA